MAVGAGSKADARQAVQVAAARVTRPVVISSANSLEPVARAGALLTEGADPLDAIIAGVEIVENDPNDHSVGYGGLPNEEGVVELDASVMHGPTHRAGAVAALRNIKNPAAVAREVARRTDHVLLVGEGALKFAKRMGFKEEELLTPEVREMWLKWKADQSREDDWLSEDEFDLPRPKSVKGLGTIEVLHTTGTIHCSAVTSNGDLAGCTSTSGLSWKLPGRVGDSPIIGAGLYTDNDVGSAGATGRGEAVIQVSGSHAVVMRMAAGDHPTEACLFALKQIASKTKLKRLQDASGRPNFNVTFYAVRKDGAYGSASLQKGPKFAVWSEGRARLEECTPLE